MKRQLLISFTVAMLSHMSVSCSASPPFTDVGIHESTINQSPVAEFTPVETIALTNHAFYCVSVIAEQPIGVNDVKRQPIVKSVCSTNAPVIGVDGSAVLLWCIKDYNYHQIPKLGFRYSEGRATEYHC